MGKPEGKRPLGRPRHRWEDNIKIDLREVGCDPGEWIDLAEDRGQWQAYIRAVMNLWVPGHGGKGQRDLLIDTVDHKMKPKRAACKQRQCWHCSFEYENFFRGNNREVKSTQ